MSKNSNSKASSAGKPPVPASIPSESEAAVNERRKAVSFGDRKGSTLNLEASKSTVEESVDYNVVYSEKLDKLSFPVGLKMKPLGDPEKEVDPVQLRLMGLPGKLELDHTTTQKYFGANARNRFFDRYQWLAEQRLKLSSSLDQPFDKLIFEEEINEGIVSGSIPFNPIRPDQGFYSRFKGMGSSGLSNEKVRIQQSAMRSGQDVEAVEEVDELDEEAMLAELAKASTDDLASTQVSSREPPIEPKASPGRSSPAPSGRKSVVGKAGSRARTTSTPLATSRRKLRRDGKGKRAADDEINKVFLAAEATVATSQDTYSEIILNSMLRSHTAADGGAPNTDQHTLDAGASRRSRLDDASVITQSTVSTLGMFYNDDQLFLGTQQSHSTSLGRSRLSGRPGGGGCSGSNFAETNDAYTRGPITSPRSKYIVGCIQEQLNPRASLLLRRNMTKELNLQHLGMGNHRAKLLAEAIKALPFVQSINIADNMLTDDGMGPIILAAVSIPGLLELNLSHNTIGPVSSHALFEYLLSSTCPLVRLILHGADVDDFECKNFVDAIKMNKSLRELELSNNKLGMAENLNTVMPDIVTGGEALAELLKLPTCNLTKLKLDWNMIRLGGAKDLAHSLSVNRTLVYLDLSYNSLATEGGIILGMSILKNKTLETLIVANNALDATATFTICAGVLENRTLKRVILDGNPIGIQGMRILMLIPIIAGNRVKVTASNCNTSIKDPRCWFDFDKLIADYTLHMDQGFERAVAIVLLHLIAGHHSFIFSKFIHELASTRAGQPSRTRSIELIQSISTEISQFFSAKQKMALEELRKIQDAASDIQTAIRLFQEVDVDGSGELDREELAVLMKKMGLHISNKRLNELMAKYDVDQGGKIELHEFLMLLKTQHKEAACRIKELVEAPIMVWKNDSKTRYIPPETGVLQISVVDGFARKKIYRIMNACDHEVISEVTRDVGGISGMNMISSSLQGTKLRLDEALSVADSMLHDNPDRVAVLKKLLVQVNDADDTRNLIHSLLDDNRTDMMRLKRDMGAALRPILGNPNGYYVLDLAKEMDRLCLEKLLEISMTSAVRRQELSKIAYGRVGDLSQHGNWSSFRNEMYDGKPVVLSPAFAAPMPRSGKLEFDFSGGARPPRDAMILSDQRVIKILMVHFLLDQTDYGVAVQKLKDAKADCDKTLGCDGTNMRECSMERMRNIGEAIETFYNSLHLRRKQFEDAQEKESSTLVDAEGVLIELFERDKTPMAPSIKDYYIRLEQKLREEEEQQAILKALEAEKAAMKAMRQSQYFGYSRASTSAPSGPSAGPTGGGTERGSVLRGSTMATAAALNLTAAASAAVAAVLGTGNPRADDDADTVTTAAASILSNHSSAGGDGNGSDEEDAAHHLHQQQMRALKATNEGDQDDDAIGDPLDPSNPHNQSTESMDWMKEFELLKQAMKAKENPEPKRINLSMRRNNIGLCQNPLQLSEPDEYLEKFQALLLSQQITVGAKAHRVVDTLEDVFARSWIYARHLALILECFVQYGYFKQTKFFGTYRVDLVVALFDRVVDVHNFELVMEILSPFEVSCLLCRLGWLNIYNPCKPEGSWELDLSRREERVVAKTLCVLATHEPGDNWTFNTFRWMRSMDSMPGWELTQPWLTEEGMPMRGLLNITYYSGEGKRKHGCRPYVAFRKSLLNLVLIAEEEVVQEDLRSKPPPPILPGDRCFQRHRALWENYLAPEFVDPNRKR